MDALKNVKYSTKALKKTIYSLLIAIVGKMVLPGTYSDVNLQSKY